MDVLSTPGGFTEAYRAHAPRAFRAALRVLGDPAAAEDVVQDVFATVWREPAKFDPARGNLSSYLAMMARSRAVDRIRTRNARDAAVERLGRQAGGDAPSEAPEDTVLRREDRSRALRAVAALPSAQRDALLLIYGRGMSAAEVADAEGVPLGTAKSRLRLGLEKTRELLEADGVTTPAAA